uniref:Cornichon family AMPA receptor auxiliary protein 3 n=1 Tax=Petromyzon marinus TaxID=7757 RepID=S4RM24_PETMA
MAFSFSAFCYMLALLLCSTLIFFAIWHVVEYSSGSPRRSAHPPPIPLCSSNSTFLVPDLLVHRETLCTKCVCTGERGTLVLMMPVYVPHAYMYLRGPAMSSPGQYDPCAVLGDDALAYCRKEGWCKLGFYLLSFFYYLYRSVTIMCAQ